MTSANFIRYDFGMRELLEDLTSLLEQGKDCVYCAVVETRGSTPQKAGAAMLVFPDGTQRGTLGGGCVEAEVKQRALRTLGADDAQPEVLAFTLDDNYGWDDGLICGGRMVVLADPLARARRFLAHGYYRRLRELADTGRGCTEVVVVDESKTPGLTVGSRFLFDSENVLAGQLGSPPNDAIATQVIPVRQRPEPSVHHGMAYLPILPRITLFIIGGGHVGQAVGRLAADVDFNIWVLDDRDSYASGERFPMAERLIVGEIGVTIKKLSAKEIDASTYCLIVTRGHAHDEEALLHLVSASAGYVGMIGSKRKIKMIFEDLMALGITADALSKVHAPLGLAIGSQTVPEIAVSIVAELIACRNLGATISSARVWVKPGV